ncbi:MAG: DUF4399 domain-containing protein [Dehalococcoidia bacterium]
MKQLRRLAVFMAVLVSAWSLTGDFGPRVRAQAAPTLKIIAPSPEATISNPISVTIQSMGVLIKAATDADPNASHFHYFVDRDPASVLRPGQPIPSGQPDIIHSALSSQPILDLSAGQHTVWVVLSHNDHTPYTPNVQAQVSFTLSAPTQAVQAPLNVSLPPLPRTGATRPLPLGLVLVVGLLLAGIGVALLRPATGRR